MSNVQIVSAALNMLKKLQKSGGDRHLIFVVYKFICLQF